MKIALIGYGKMGKTIEELILASGKHEIVGRYSKANSEAELIPENIRKADVAIEFTSPYAAEKNLLLCLQAGVPVVCGSTGWYTNLENIKAEFQVKNASMVYASNFSVGVNLFFSLNKKLATMMAAYPEYKISLNEIHHTQKKDSPSGTAITLIEDIKAIHPQKEIPHTSQRIDPVVGTHTINYDSEIDSLSITHEAHSRKGFAMGAILAAEWLVKNNGVHSFSEVLGIE